MIIAVDKLDLTSKYRVRKAGIELEGGWDSKIRRPWNEVSRDGGVIRDGSIRGIDPAQYFIGELPSKPLSVAELLSWMRQWYPDVVNESCGMHVHMSFGSALLYQKLMTPDFMDTICDSFLMWAKEKKFPDTHHFITRLTGGSVYCQRRFSADKQVQRTRKEYDREQEGNRYTIVNYPFRLTGTIEVRVLPMMDNADLAVDAVTHLIKLTNGCLTALMKEQEDLINAAFMSASEPAAQETHRICV